MNFLCSKRLVLHRKSRTFLIIFLLSISFWRRELIVMPLYMSSYLKSFDEWRIIKWISSYIKGNVSFRLIQPSSKLKHQLCPTSVVISEFYRLQGLCLLVSCSKNKFLYVWFVKNINRKWTFPLKQMNTLRWQGTPKLATFQFVRTNKCYLRNSPKQHPSQCQNYISIYGI